MDDFYKIFGKVDASIFFQSLGIYFKDATTLFIEGTSIEEDVLTIYKNNLEESEYLPRAGTIFPRSTKLSCKYSAEFMNELALIAEKHAASELCDHLHLYKNREPIVKWMDAFSDEILVSKKVPKGIVDEFSEKIKKN